MQMIKRAVLASGTGIAIAFLAACSDSPTQPSAPVVRNVAPPSFALLAQPTNFPDNPNTITVCSAGASATFNVTFDNTIGNIQSPPLSGSFPNYTLAVAANTCATIWTKPNVAPGLDPTTTATVVQTGQASGFQFSTVEASGVQNGPNPADNATKTATLTANAFHGSTATFTQVAVAPPEGCSPGYYKKHIQPNSNDTFASLGFINTNGVNLTNLTLAAALDFGGGNTLSEKEQILLRQAAAAYMNAVRLAGYPLSAAQVVSMVNTALASDNLTTITNLATQLNTYNNLEGPRC